MNDESHGKSGEKRGTTDGRGQIEILPSTAYQPRLISLGADASVRRERSLSPLAPLFPTGGDARLLRTMKEKLENRLESLRDEVATFGEKSFEETMIRQVLEWISQMEER